MISNVFLFFFSCVQIGLFLCHDHPLFSLSGFIIPFLSDSRSFVRPPPARCISFMSHNVFSSSRFPFVARFFPFSLFASFCLMRIHLYIITFAASGTHLRVASGWSVT